MIQTLGFEIEQSKNCVLYTKRIYSFKPQIDPTFFQSFEIFGRPEVTEVSKYLPGSFDFFKIRSYEFSFEISGAVNGQQLLIVYKLEDQNTMDLVESELSNWLLT